MNWDAEDEPWLDIAEAPRTGERILVTWLGKVQIATFNREVMNWQEWPDGDFDNGGEVTAWMPLPDPKPRR